MLPYHIIHARFLDGLAKAMFNAWATKKLHQQAHFQGCVSREAARTLQHGFTDDTTRFRETAVYRAKFLLSASLWRVYLPLHCCVTDVSCIVGYRIPHVCPLQISGVSVENARREILDRHTNTGDLLWMFVVGLMSEMAASDWRVRCDVCR